MTRKKIYQYLKGVEKKYATFALRFKLSLFDSKLQVFRNDRNISRNLQLRVRAKTNSQRWGLNVSYIQPIWVNKTTGIAGLFRGFCERRPAEDMRQLALRMWIYFCASPKVDGDGFLPNFEDWDEKVAQGLAEREGVGQLNDEHMEIVKFMRSY